MPLETKSFDTLINDQANAMQGVANQILDFAVGSDFRAIIEANGGLSLWSQSLAVALLAVARLATSHGIEVDSFVGDFGLERTKATPSFGLVTFSRFTATQQALIQAGSFDRSTIGDLVSSSATGVQYSVYADTDNPNYNPDLNAYVIPVNITSASIPVIALINGTIGNVLANQITTIQTNIPYVNSVNNSQPISNGTDQETDQALKAGFPLYLNSLSKAVKQALEAAILSVPGVVRFKLIENEDVNANPKLGFFYSVIDDGSGNASGPLLAMVQDVLDANRGFTIAFSDYAPIPFTTNITVNIETNGSYPDATVQANVTAALTTFISNSAFDALIPYSKIAEIVYDADPTIINLTSWTLNSGTSDIQLTGRQIAIVGTLTVNIA